MSVPIIKPIKGKGSIHQGFTLPLKNLFNNPDESSCDDR